MYIHHSGGKDGMLPYLMFVGLGLVGGSNFLFMKIAVSALEPLQVVWLRMLFGTLPIIGLALLRRSLRLRDARHLPHFAGMALLANVVPFLFFAKAAHYLQSGISGVISGTIPLMTVLLAMLLLPAER